MLGADSTVPMDGSQEVVMRSSRRSLVRTGLIVGVVVGSIVVVAARVGDLKRWFISQWDTPHGLTGWVFGAFMAATMDDLYRLAAEYARLRTDDRRCVWIRCVPPPICTECEPCRWHRQVRYPVEARSPDAPRQNRIGYSRNRSRRCGRTALGR